MAAPTAGAQTAGVATPAAPAAGPDGAQTIVVTGIRASQLATISTKRNADTIVDAISAQDLGKLPDITIADSLQRVTGLQIRREAGEGSTINIRGLPQVGMQLNGEEFISAGAITSTQPNLSDVPSQLLKGVNVYKSSTASLMGSGISGTVDLRTLRPLELKKGTIGSLAAEYGKGSKVTDPSKSVNGVFAFSGPRFGVLASAVYSDSNAYNAQSGLANNFGVRNESASGANSFQNGAQRGTPVTGPGGAVLGYDLNGNGTVNDAFVYSGGHTLLKKETQRKRTGLNVALQADITDDLRLTAEAFHTKQDQFDRAAGFMMGSTSWSDAQYTPGVSSPKGLLPAGSGTSNDGFVMNTVQRFDVLVPNLDSYNETNVTKSKSTNLNIELEWDKGGPLKMKLRATHGSAKQSLDNSYAQFTLTDGQQWSNGIGYYPGGNVALNTGGFRALTLPGSIDYSGKSAVWTLPTGITSLLANPANYALKTISSENNNRADASATALRLDGNYKLSAGLNFDFGLRHGQREVENFAFDRLAPMYAGRGASDPRGCLVKWKAVDVRLDSTQAANGSTRPVADCNAGNGTDFYTAGLTRKITDPTLGGQFGTTTGMPGTAPALLTLNLKAMDNPAAWHEALYPGEVEAVNPATSYGVKFTQNSMYGQANFKGDLGGMPYRANAGLRYIQTELEVRQNILGANRPYGAPAFDIGDSVTQRKFNDTLPAFNLSLDVTPEVKVRAAVAKNMQILDLQNWGGGLQLNYGIDTSVTPNIFRVLGGSQSGNTQLDPWRSTNFDLSLEWYNRPGGILSLALYRIKIDRSIDTGVISRSDLPDLDGVVRRAVNVTTPVQVSGSTLSGFELSTKQRLNFLPGFLADFGVEATYTLSNAKLKDDPKDLAGNSQLFGDNSRNQTNLVLWYERGGFQARIAQNTRSKRQVRNTEGLTIYQEPTSYVDASLSYDVIPNVTLFTQVSNLTNEYERYYATWTDQKMNTNYYERKVSVGLRAKF